MKKKILGLFLLLCFLFPFNSSYSAYYDFNSGTAGFTTFGNAMPSSGSVELTASAAGQYGSIFLDTPLYAASFNASFDFYIDSTGPSGSYRGDGLTFAWVTSPGLGGGGGELGFTGLTGYIVEFDTYWNEGYEPLSSKLFWDQSNHIAVAQAVNAPLSLADTPEMVGNGWHKVDILFNNGLIQVEMDGTEFINHTLSGYIGSDAYFGFTGSTGASYSRQLIDNFEINVVPIPTSIILLGSGLLGLGVFNRKK